MKKDLFILYLLFLFGLGYLFYVSDHMYKYPYFIVASFIFLISLGIFFSFLPYISKAWFQRLIIVNIGVILLIPIIEGMEWILFSLLYFVLLSFVIIGYVIFNKRSEKED